MKISVEGRPDVEYEVPTKFDGYEEVVQEERYHRAISLQRAVEFDRREREAFVTALFRDPKERSYSQFVIIGILIILFIISITKL